MYIVAFNGPPYSGKDTLARMLLERIAAETTTFLVQEESLSLPLRNIAYAMAGFNYPSRQISYEEFKESFFPAFKRTGRQLMIDVSERFLKPTYTKAVLAEMLIQRIKYIPQHSLILIRDSGFQLEVNPLIDAVSPLNLMVVRVSRPACNFDNDSRESIYHPHLPMNMEISNDGDLKELRVEAGRLYGRLVNQKGWKF